jgi:hypothetical protein
MTAQAIVIAVLSGGFVGVVWKSGFDRAERFRDRMYEAADHFLTAADTALGCLEQAARTVVEVRDVHAELVAMIEKVNATAEAGGFELISAAGGPAEKLEPLIADLVAEVPGSVEGVRQVLDDLRDEWHRTVSEPKIREALDDVLAAARRWASAIESRPPGATAAAARLAVSRVVAARPRVALVFAGRSHGGDDVVDASERVAEHLGRLRELLVETIDDHARLTEWPSIWDKAESAVSDFAVKANGCARHLWL